MSVICEPRHMDGIDMLICLTHQHASSAYASQAAWQSKSRKCSIGVHKHLG